MRRFSAKEQLRYASRFREVVQRGWLDFMQLFYPRLCIGCGESLNREEKDLCLTCMMELPLLPDQQMKGGGFMEERFHGRIELEGVTALLQYEKESVAQRILHDLKYHGNREIGRRLGGMLGAKLKQTSFATVDAVLPVPLHPNRLKSRGYNQSEWIAKGIAESLQKEVWTDVLRREVENVSQTKKDSFQRWKNVEGIFSLSDVRSLDGLHLLVVDDVLTTGATLEASILPLKSGKNVRVSVAVLAVVGL